MSSHGITPPGNFKVLSVEEIKALYPGVPISPNRDKPRDPQVNFELVQKNLRIMNELRRIEMKTKPKYVRKSESTGEE